MLHLLNMLPDHQKVEGKFKLRIAMAVFQGQIENFSVKHRATQQCLMEVCGSHHVIIRQMVGRGMFPIQT